MKRKSFFWIVILFSVVVFSVRLYPQGRIITDYPYYTTFDKIHYSVFLNKSPEVYYASELIDAHGKSWEKQKLEIHHNQLTGTIIPDYHLPTGCYWIRVYPAAFYGNSPAVLYQPLVIINAEDLEKDQWEKTLQKITGKPAIYFLTGKEPGGRDGSGYQIGLIDEAGKIISGSASIIDNTNRKRFDLTNGRNGFFTSSCTPETGHSYRFLLKNESNDSLSFSFNRSDIQYKDLSYCDLKSEEESEDNIRITADKNIYLPDDSIQIQILQAGVNHLDSDSGMLVTVSESIQDETSFNKKPVPLIRKNNEGLEISDHEPQKTEDCFCLMGNYINPATGVPRANYTIALIGLGQNPWIAFTHADKNGDFTFDASGWPENNSVYISTIGQPVEGLTYNDHFFRSFTDQPRVNFSLDDFAPLDSFVTESRIRSVLHFQYATGKTAIPRNAEQILYDTTRIYKEPDVTYDLNDYIQFNDVADIIHNILIYVHLTSTKNGDRLIIFNNRNPNLNKNPLYLINGIPTRDLQLVLGLNVKDIQKIDLLYKVNSIKPFGIAGLGGIMAIYTTQNVEIPNTIKVNLKGLHREEGFYTPEREEGLPDFSPVVFWNPNVNMTGNFQKIRFRLNNILSDMKIKVLEFNKSGTLIRSTAVIKIKPGE